MTYASTAKATTTPRRIKEMRPDEIAATLARDGRLIVPVGTCEQHGRHLPLGSDTLIVEHLADDLSAEFGILRAPTLEYGVNVDTERGFAGNSSLRKKTLHKMLNDLLDTWESTGVKEFILLTAHEHDPHQEALATVTTTTARVRTRSRMCAYMAAPLAAVANVGRPIDPLLPPGILSHPRRYRRSSSRDII